MDGEWTTSASSFAAGSGDGAPGGNFIFRFNAVAGDASHDGKVSSSDMILVRNQTGQNDNATNYRDDINGDGKMSSSDMILVRNQTGVNIGIGFPEPILPSAGPIVSSDTASSSPSMAVVSNAASSIARPAVAANVPVTLRVMDGITGHHVPMVGVMSTAAAAASFSVWNTSNNSGPQQKKDLAIEALDAVFAQYSQ